MILKASSDFSERPPDTTMSPSVTSLTPDPVAATSLIFNRLSSSDSATETATVSAEAPGVGSPAV